MPTPGFAALGQFRIHYPDGKSTDVRLTSKAVVEAERRWPGVNPDGSDRYRPNEGVHYMVWITLGRPHDDFDSWLDEGFVVEPVDDGPDPTKPAAGADTSVSSPRRPASRRVNSNRPKSKAS